MPSEATLILDERRALDEGSPYAFVNLFVLSDLGSLIMSPNALAFYSLKTSCSNCWAFLREVDLHMGLSLRSIYLGWACLEPMTIIRHNNYPPIPFYHYQYDKEFITRLTVMKGCEPCLKTARLSVYVGLAKRGDRI